MSYEHIRENVRKARKLHRCVWCSEEIRPGEKYHDRAYKFEGYFCYDKMHSECMAACKNSYDIGDGFEAHQQIRGKTLEESEYIKSQADTMETWEPVASLASKA